MDKRVNSFHSSLNRVFHVFTMSLKSFINVTFCDTDSALYLYKNVPVYPHDYSFLGYAFFTNLLL